MLEKPQKCLCDDSRAGEGKKGKRKPERWGGPAHLAPVGDGEESGCVLNVKGSHHVFVLKVRSGCGNLRKRCWGEMIMPIS